MNKTNELAAEFFEFIMDPRALSELFPNWKEMGALLHTPVTGDRMLTLSGRRVGASAVSVAAGRIGECGNGAFADCGMPATGQTIAPAIRDEAA